VSLMWSFALKIILAFVVFHLYNGYFEAFMIFVCF